MKRKASTQQPRKGEVMKGYRWGLVLLMSSQLLGCATPSERTIIGKPLEGKVLEINTNKPIEGAFVIVRWQGTVSLFVDSQTQCYHVEVTTTDKDGRYRTQEWEELVAGSLSPFDYPYIEAYKSGYSVFWLRRPDQRPENYLQGVKYLEPFEGTVKDRLEYLGRLDGMECGSYGYAPKLIPYYRALYEEAKSLPTGSKEERRMVGSLHYSADYVEFGDAETRRRYREGMYEE